MSSNEVIIVRCPICGKPYQVAELGNPPTCGDPSCIREARARGLPFIPTRVKPESAKPAARKRTKSRKSIFRS